MEKIAKLKHCISKFLTTIIKIIAVVFFSIIFIDKINIISYIREIITKLSIDSINYSIYYLFIGIKSLLLSFPFLVGIAIMLVQVLFAIVCFSNFIYLLIVRIFYPNSNNSNQLLIKTKKINYCKNYYTRNNRILC